MHSGSAQSHKLVDTGADHCPIETRPRHDLIFACLPESLKHVANEGQGRLATHCPTTFVRLARMRDPSTAKTAAKEHITETASRARARLPPAAI